jgi:hypothetical protein
VLLIVQGLFIAALGQLILLFVEIAENTRQTNVLLRARLRPTLESAYAVPSFLSEPVAPREAPTIPPAPFSAAPLESAPVVSATPRVTPTLTPAPAPAEPTPPDFPTDFPDDFFDPTPKNENPNA